MTFNVVLYVTTSHMDYEYLENVKYQYTEKKLNILTCIFHVGKFYVKLLDYGIFVTYNMYMTIDKHTGNYNLQFTVLHCYHPYTKFSLPYTCIPLGSNHSSETKIDHKAISYMQKSYWYIIAAR